MGDDSTPREVKQTFAGEAQMYKYEFKNGSDEPYYFTGNHTLALRWNGGVSMKKKGPSYVVITPTEVVDTSKGYPLTIIKNKFVSFNSNHNPNAFDVHCVWLKNVAKIFSQS